MLAAGLRRSFSQTRVALARCSRAASTGSSYAPVQRRAVPKQLESALEQDEAPPRSREVRSVAEMHVAHCHSLASGPPADGTADATWNWAGLRACKLAEVMTPRDLASCAAAFALAERRDFRVFYLLAEEAIGKAKTFGAEEAAKMLQAYADIRMRYPGLRTDRLDDVHQIYASKVREGGSVAIVQDDEGVFVRTKLLQKNGATSLVQGWCRQGQEAVRTVPDEAIFGGWPALSLLLSHPMKKLRKEIEFIWRPGAEIRAI
ncbi:unnamed protein product [Symbiodinium sp. KB8]|nr:unnamed protein product [Symbiodinium sp. KB8]